MHFSVKYGINKDIFTIYGEKKCNPECSAKTGAICNKQSQCNKNYISIQ